MRASCVSTVLLLGLILAGAPLRAQDSAKIDADVKSLIEKLKSSDEVVRLQAAKSLKGLGPKAKEARPALLLLLRDESDSDVRKLAGEAYRSIDGKEPAPNLKALTRRLEDPDASVRLGALKAVKAMGANAKPAVLPLTRVAQADVDDDVRAAAKDIIKTLGAIKVNDEVARTNARISALQQHIGVARFDLQMLTQIRNMAQQKIQTLAAVPTPDVAVMLVAQNAVAVNNAKIDIIELDLKLAEKELAEQEQHMQALRGLEDLPREE